MGIHTFVNLLCFVIFVVIWFYSYVNKPGYLSSIMSSGIALSNIVQHNSGVKQQQKKTRLYFCHIAKTGGTTLENVVVNFALEHHLHIALFEGRPYAFPWPSGDLEARLSKSTNLSEKLDVMYQHTVFNKSALYRVMHGDSLRISLLRHPMAQLKSWFNFAGFHRNLGIYHNPNPVEEFLKDPEKWDKVIHINGGKASMTKNFMASYFGLHTTFNATECSHTNNISSCLISVIEDNFNLILINEYYDESLLMLQDLLGWGIEDILYLQLRKANYVNKYRATNDVFIQKHKTWSPIDYNIYHHFRAKLQDKLKNLGEPFYARTKIFKNALYQFRAFCVDIIKLLWNYKHNFVDKEFILKHLRRSFIYQEIQKGYVKTSNVTASRCLTLALDPVIVTKIIKVHYNGTLCTGADKMFCSGTLLSGFLPLELFSANSPYKWPLLFGNFVDHK